MSEYGFRYHYGLLLGRGDVNVDKIKRKISFLMSTRSERLVYCYSGWYIYDTIANFIFNLSHNSTVVLTILFLCSSGGRKYLSHTIVPWLRYVY